MQVGLVGLGANMVRYRLKAGHRCVAYDPHPDAIQVLVPEGAIGTTSLEAFANTLKKPRAVWMMVPAAAVDGTLKTLPPLLEDDDVVIDGGDAYDLDDLRRATELKSKCVHHMDVGTSSVWGSERGDCLRIGGEKTVALHLDSDFAALAPSIDEVGVTPGRERIGTTAEHGYLHYGSRGEDDFADKLLSALPYQFGGHNEKAALSKGGAS
jgi:6-phosphogluconate dehydrogenase